MLDQQIGVQAVKWGWGVAEIALKYRITISNRVTMKPNELALSYNDCDSSLNIEVSGMPHFQTKRANKRSTWISWFCQTISVFMLNNPCLPKILHWCSKWVQVCGWVLDLYVSVSQHACNPNSTALSHPLDNLRTRNNQEVYAKLATRRSSLNR
jgi:hypothetical protein